MAGTALRPDSVRANPEPAPADSFRHSRRAALGALVLAPIIGTMAATPAAVQPTVAGPRPNQVLWRALDAHDARGWAMNGKDLSEATWEAWSDDGERIYDLIQRLPNAPENAAIKARAVLSMHCGHLDWDEDSHAERMLKDVVRSLTGGR